MSTAGFVGRSYFNVVDGVLCSVQVKNPMTFTVSACDHLAVWVASFRHRHLAPESGDPSPAQLAALFDSFVHQFEAGGVTVVLERATDISSDATLSVGYKHAGTDHTVSFILHACPALERDGFAWKLMCDLYRGYASQATMIRSRSRPMRTLRGHSQPPLQPVPRPKLHLGSTVRTKESSGTANAKSGDSTGSPSKAWRPVNTNRPNLVSRSCDRVQDSMSMTGTFSSTNGGTAGNHQLSGHKGQWPNVLTESKQSLQRQLLATQLDVIRLQNQLAAVVSEAGEDDVLAPPEVQAQHGNTAATGWTPASHEQPPVSPSRQPTQQQQVSPTSSPSAAAAAASTSMLPELTPASRRIAPTTRTSISGS
eukprot:PhM_4_TR4272/c0_g1_i1/m.67858